jgi:hypothetical protein
LKDARRVEISLGDQVLYYKTGRYPTVIVGTVIEFKKKVKLGNLTGLSNKGDHPETCWADRRQLVVTGGLPLRDEEKPVPAVVTLPETSRVDLGVLCPHKPGESAVEWTSRALSLAHEHGTNRQCSIGWHGACSDSGLGEDAECNCICHGDLVETYTVEGHAEGGEVTVIRAERGKQMWTEQEGEPETMWAWWVYARSETEAAVQGATKERNRLAG